MYFPYQKGRYEVAPGLLPITQDFGNGAWDQHLFQMGDDFQNFRRQFEENRLREPVSKYVCESSDAEAKSMGAIAHAIATRLACDYPNQVTFKDSLFESRLTGESFVIKMDTNSVLMRTGSIAYLSAWDAIGAQVPEDLAIWKLNSDGSEEIEALHLNAPNHWAAGEKIGKSFAAVHSPVAHLEKIVPWAVNILHGIIEKGPFVRFAWGVGTDSRLNHHPVPPHGVSPEVWTGRSFDPTCPVLFTRVERQVLWGFPELNRALFTIRTYFQDVSALKKMNPDAVIGLTNAILSMSPESLAYKGLSADRHQMIQWLRKPPDHSG